MDDEKNDASWNSQRYIYGSPIPVGFAFKRPYEGGHGNQSQHYAGVAFDVGQTLTSTQRTRLWNSAKNSGVWYYVEPISLTPTWVHFDKRFRETSMFYWRISAFKERKFE